MFDPYGKVTVLDGNGTPRTENVSLYGNPWTFTGRRLDGETGLMYYRNRMYSVDLGRFVSRDPIGYVDGYSLYSAYFVPRLTDPSGMAVKHEQIKLLSEAYKSCGTVDVWVTDMVEAREKPGPGNFELLRYEMRAMYTPKDQSAECCCCKQIDFRQRFYGTYTPHPSLPANVGWHIDATLPEFKQPKGHFYNNRLHGAPPGTKGNEPPAKGLKKYELDSSSQLGMCDRTQGVQMPAIMFDSPTITTAHKGQKIKDEFETCVVCVETGFVYGCFSWGVSRPEKGDPSNYIQAQLLPLPLWPSKPPVWK